MSSIKKATTNDSEYFNSLLKQTPALSGNLNNSIPNPAENVNVLDNTSQSPINLEFVNEKSADKYRQILILVRITGLEPARFRIRS